MASIHREQRRGKTYFRLQFYDRDRVRRSIRLGEIAERTAERICEKVTYLVSASIAGSPLDDETSRWCARIGQDLADKLANAGLIPKRESASLRPFIDAYIASRTDARPNTIRNLTNSRQRLTNFFGDGVQPARRDGGAVRRLAASPRAGRTVGCHHQQGGQARQALLSSGRA